MAYVDWKIKGRKLGACNCSYGCPCEFNAPPTYGECEGLEAMEIDEGYFGEVRLDGLRYVAKYCWPGPVHEGGGEAQAIIDERATSAQREALLKILSGEEQEAYTVFNIYGATMEKEYDPIFTAIEFEWDRERRIGRVSVPGVVEVALAPIKNPVTGKEHRAIILLPEGFEFRDCDMASSTFKGMGDIVYDYAGRYGQFWYAAYGPYGIIEEESPSPWLRK
jgi:hypothetical protein